MTRHSKQRSPVRIGKRTRLGISVIGIGVWATGGIWLILHFFFTSRSEFGPQVNPMEPWSLKLHGLFAFASIWLLGLLWGVHISSAWPIKRRRWSGGVLTGILLLLIGSGYMLYYVGEDNIRSYVSTIHWAIGLALPCLYLWHRVKREKFKRAQIRSREAQAEVIRAGPNSVT